MNTCQCFSFKGEESLARSNMVARGSSLDETLAILIRLNSLREYISVAKFSNDDTMT